MIRNGFLGHLVEHGTNLPSNMGLQGRGHTLRSVGSRRDRVVLPISAFPGVDGHAPGSLVLIVSSHDGSLSVQSASAIVTDNRRISAPKNPRDNNRFQVEGRLAASFVAGLLTPIVSFSAPCETMG